jgi:hypothetical protein
VAAIVCLLWCALGCYGAYVLFVHGGIVVPAPSLPLPAPPPSSTLVIQLMSSQSRDTSGACAATANSEECLSKNDGGAAITLKDWEKMKLDVDAAIRLTSKDEGTI